MKKISLKNLNLKEVDQLSREQLKNVLGGYSESGTTTEESTTTTNNEICICECDFGGFNFTKSLSECVAGSSSGCHNPAPPEFNDGKGSYTCSVQSAPNPYFA